MISLRDAHEKIVLDEELEEKTKDKKLISVLSFLDENERFVSWEFSYKDKNGNIMRLIVTPKEVVFEENLKPLREENSETIYLEDLNIEETKALDIAHEEFSKNFKQDIQKVFISLSKKENKLLWIVSLVTKTLSIVQIRIDASSGNIVDSSQKNLF